MATAETPTVRRQHQEPGRLDRQADRPGSQGAGRLPETVHGIKAAAAAVVAGPAAAAGRRRRARRGADRVRRGARGHRRQQDQRHQGRPRRHRPGPEGGQGRWSRPPPRRSRPASPRRTPRSSRRSWKRPAPRSRSSNPHGARLARRSGPRRPSATTRSPGRSEGRCPAARLGSNGHAPAAAPSTTGVRPGSRPAESGAGELGRRPVDAMFVRPVRFSVPIGVGQGTVPPVRVGMPRPPAPHPSPLEERDPMPTARPPCGASSPTKQRNFGRIHDVFPVPDLTEIQTRSYERFLQADLAGREARRQRAGGGLPRDLPDRELRQDAQAGIHQVRPGQAALRARRVPPAPPDLRPPACTSGSA